MLLQQLCQNEERDAQGAGNDDAVKAREQVAGEVVVGHPELEAEVLAVSARVQGAHGSHEAQHASAEATCPPPQVWANGSPAWASTNRALAAVSVSTHT